MFAELLRQEVTVWRPGTRDAASGETVESWESPVSVGVLRGWLQPRKSSEDVDHRQQETLEGVLYLPEDADIVATDRVTIDGEPRPWSVTGPPLRRGRPGGEHHLQIGVEQVAG